MKRVEIDNTQNLDLNATARKNEKTLEKFSPYLINATYAVLKADLAYQIGSFNLEKEMSKLASSIGASTATLAEPSTTEEIKPPAKTTGKPIAKKESRDIASRGSSASGKTGASR